MFTLNSSKIKRPAYVRRIFQFKKPLDPRFDGTVKNHESAIGAEDEARVIDLKQSIPGKDYHNAMEHFVPEGRY